MTPPKVSAWTPQVDASVPGPWAYLDFIVTGPTAADSVVSKNAIDAFVWANGRSHRGCYATVSQAIGVGQKVIATVHGETPEEAAANAARIVSDHNNIEAAESERDAAIERAKLAEGMCAEKADNYANLAIECDAKDARIAVLEGIARRLVDSVELNDVGTPMVDSEILEELSAALEGSAKP